LKESSHYRIGGRKMKKGEKMSEAQKKKLKKTFKKKKELVQTTNPFNRENQKKQTKKVGVKFEKDVFEVMDEHLKELYEEEKAK